MIDCANGAAYKVAPEVLWELGADIVAMGVTPNGTNINLDCGSTAPEALCRKVREMRADIGIALDGDADRVVIVDEQGHLVDGDQLLAAIAESWLVHYASAGMLGEAERQAEEIAYLEDPSGALGAAAWETIGAIGRCLDLDYAGADVSILPDGRVVVFEANATMLVHPEAEGELLRKNPYVDRITSAFQALVQASL